MAGTPKFGKPFRRGDGRWVVPLYDDGGRQGQISVPSKEGVQDEAGALRYAAEEVVRRGVSTMPKSDEPVGPTVAELLPEWLKGRQSDPDVSGSTFDANESNFKIHISPVFGDVPVAAFGTTEVGKDLGSWIRRLKTQQEGQTVKNIVSTFKLFLDYVVSPEGGSLLVANPLRQAWAIKLLPKRKKTDARFALLDGPPITQEMVQEVINNRQVPLIRRARYAVVFTDPARDGEIAGLRLRDLDFDAAIPWLEVCQACVANHKDGHALPGPPKKVWSLRKLPLHPCAVAALVEWLDQGWEEFVGRRPNLDDPVFPREDGGWARPDSASFLREDLAASKQPTSINGVDLVFHDARGSVATWLMDAGVKDSLIRRFLGHAPQGAAEARYFKGNLLGPLSEAHTAIELTWLSDS